MEQKHQPSSKEAVNTTTRDQLSIPLRNHPYTIQKTPRKALIIKELSLDSKDNNHLQLILILGLIGYVILKIQRNKETQQKKEVIRREEKVPLKEIQTSREKNQSRSYDSYRKVFNSP